MSNMNPVAAIATMNFWGHDSAADALKAFWATIDQTSGPARVLHVQVIRKLTYMEAVERREAQNRVSAFRMSKNR
jgi:hypothetical protein